MMNPHLNHDRESSSSDASAGASCLKIADYNSVQMAQPPSTGFLNAINSTMTLRHHANAMSTGEVFTYDYLGDWTTTQEEVFEKVGKIITDNCLQGYNGTIFAYGQTGSGKTYTMLGPYDEHGSDIDYAQRGLIPRILEYLFESIAIEQRKNTHAFQFLCKCSMVEIYNEAIYDLLDPSTPSCVLREDMKRGVFVDGNIEEIITSPEDALQILQMGSRNRHVAATSMNRESSRSHCIFTLYIQSRSIDSSSTLTDLRESRFHLVDLAGSERQSLTGTIGLRLKEAGNINKSLLALSQTINALVENGKFVRYRDSKLTFLLRDSLGGNAKTLVIANVSPALSAFHETLSTLKFAQRAKLIKNKATINKDTLGNVSQLQAEIKRLKIELEMLKSKPGMAHECLDENIDSNMSKSSLSINKYMADILERQLKLEGEKNDLVKKVQLLEDLCSRREQQIQSEKMIVKFRDSTIQILKTKLQGEVIVQEQDEEKEALLTALKELQLTCDKHPEVLKLTALLNSHEERYHLLKAFEEDYTSFENKLAKLESSFRFISHKFVALERQNEKFQNGNELQVELERLKLENGHLKFLNGEIKANASRYSNVDDEITFKPDDYKILELQEQLSFILDEKTAVENQLEELKSLMTFKEDEINRPSAQVIDCQETIDVQESEFEKQKQQMLELQKVVLENNARIKEFTIHIENEERSKKQIVYELDISSAKNKEDQKIICDLVRSLKEASDEQSRLIKEKERFSKEYEALKTAMFNSEQNYMHSLNEKEKTLMDQENKLTTLSLHYTGLQLKHTTLEKEYKELEVKDSFQMDSLRNDYENKIRHLHLEKEQILSEVKEQYKKEMIILEEQHNIRLIQIKQSHSDALQNRDDYHQQELIALKAQYEECTEQLKRDRDSHLGVLRQSHEQQIQELDYQHHTAIEQTRLGHVQTLEENEKQKIDELTHLKHQYRVEMDTISNSMHKNYESKINTITSASDALKRSIEHLETKLKESSQLIRVKETEVEKLQKENESIKLQSEKNFNKEISRFNAMKKSMEEELMIQSKQNQSLVEKERLFSKRVVELEALQQERSEAQSQMKQELTRLRSSYTLLQGEHGSLQAKYRADVAEKECHHQKEMKAKVNMVEVIEKKLKDLEALIKTYKGKLAESENARKSMAVKMKALIETSQNTQLKLQRSETELAPPEGNIELTGKLQNQQNEIHSLHEEITRLRKENDKLIQHQNMKQKLQYHVQIKKENNDLKEENTTLKETILKYQQKLEHIGRNDAVFHQLISSSSDLVENKENIQ